MHPADQFEAFKRLAEERGLGAEEIAARFGVTPRVVRHQQFSFCPRPSRNSPWASFECWIVTIVEADFAFERSVFLTFRPTIAGSLVHFVVAFPGEVNA